MVKIRLVSCVDADSGKVLWTREFKSNTHKKHKQNSFASSTPTADKERVYSVWGHKGELEILAFDHSGKTVWERDLGGVNGNHGFGVSPIIYEDLLILPNDQEKGGGYVIALDKRTGKTQWKILRATSKASKLLRHPAYILTARKGTTDPDQLVAWCNEPRARYRQTELGEGCLWKASFGAGGASPITCRKLVYGTCGFTTKDKHLVAMDPKSGEEVWRTEKSVPHIPTPIIANDLLFMWGDGGILSCLDPLDGKSHWRVRVEDIQDTFYGSPVAAGNRIFCISSFGKVAVIEAAKEFKQLAVNDLNELCRSTPAIANGNLYIRTFENLICIQGH